MEERERRGEGEDLGNPRALSLFKI